MPKFVGVLSGDSFHVRESWLKRAALLFDELVYSRIWSRKSEALIDWLIGHEIVRIHRVVESDTASASEEYIKEFNAKAKLLQNVDYEHLAELDNLRSFVAQLIEHSLRVETVLIREELQVDAYPVFAWPVATPLHSTDHAVVARVVIGEFPEPSNDVAWEDILTFRSDETNRLSTLELRNWMGDMARGTLTPIEVAQKLEYLIEQRRNALALHGMRVINLKRQTWLATIPEYIAKFVKVEWGDMLKIPFAIQEDRIKLIEGEQNTPGKEVAYIVKAQDNYGN